jgi:putative ATP-binding cassette transporter
VFKFPLRVYWQQITPWWRSEEKRIAWGGTFALIGMSFISVYIGVLFNDWTKAFYNTLEDRSLPDFLHQALVYIPLVALLLLDFCSRNYVTAWLSFRWRRWMTSDLTARWLDRKHYYKIAYNSKLVDNPDQRISIDLQEIAYYTVSLFSSFFREGINVITFSIILWGISSSIDLSFMGTPIKIPGFLVWAAFVF